LFLDDDRRGRRIGDIAALARRAREFLIIHDERQGSTLNSDRKASLDETVEATAAVRRAEFQMHNGRSDNMIPGQRLLCNLVKITVEAAGEVRQMDTPARSDLPSATADQTFSALHVAEEHAMLCC
jgi:hypothetical protein